MYRFWPLNLLGGKHDRFSWRSWLAVPLMWVLVLVGWAMFRSADLHQLGAWFAALGHWQAVPGPALAVFLPLAADPHGPLILLQLLTLKYRDETRLRLLPWPAKGLVYLLLLLLIVSSSEQSREFIYFQFYCAD